jgi:histidinol dehydrogenase
MSDGKIQIVDVRYQSSALLEALRQRSLTDLPPEVEETVREIVSRVREEGDRALVEYERRFDCPTLTVENLRVPDREIDAAYSQVSPEWVGAFRRAKENIYAFHARLRPGSWLDSFDGLWLGQKITPINAAGLYVPAGKAPLPSTLAMCAVPAKVAGVNRLVLATAPALDGSLHPTMLVAAAECGVDEIYRMGGAQAIAAMAYGTDTIEPVDKIVGPGNPYVIMAKKQVFGTVGIESLPGPSESLIIADGDSDPVLVAADLLSQAEHTGDNLVILLTPSQELAEAVREQAYLQLAALPRMELTSSSLGEYGVIAIVKDLQHAVEISNDIAPEHLELAVNDPLELLSEVENAGCICLGHLTTVPLADYAAGPSHVLPTNGTARFSSPLSVEDFIKRSSVVYAAERGLQRLGKDVVTLAEGEGLFAHAEAVKKRLS